MELEKIKELESYGLRTIEDINNEIECTIEYLEDLLIYRQNKEKVIY